jgi:DnaJ-class molecular chaperone
MSEAERLRARCGGGCHKELSLSLFTTPAALPEGKTMGFNIYGIRKKSEEGRHFGISGLWWAALGDYVLDVCSDLFQERGAEWWGVNQGTRVSGRTATAVAKRLHELLETGAVKQYERQFRKEQKAKLKTPCSCMKAKRKDGPKAPKRKARCPKCNGTGIVKKDGTIYPFTEETVKDFAAFCRDSGGFEIR